MLPILFTFCIRSNWWWRWYTRKKALDISIQSIDIIYPNHWIKFLLSHGTIIPTVCWTGFRYCPEKASNLVEEILCSFQLSLFLFNFGLFFIARIKLSIVTDSIQIEVIVRFTIECSWVFGVLRRAIVLKHVQNHCSESTGFNKYIHKLPSIMLV